MKNDKQEMLATKDKKRLSDVRAGVKLKKNIGLVSGTSFVVGSVIGAGIFITPRGVLKETRSVGITLSVWAGAGLLSLLGSLAYAELGCLITKSGCDYPYLWRGLGRVIAFLFAWTKIMIMTPSDLAIDGLSIAEHMVTFFDYCGSPKIPSKLIAALTILTLATINCWDTKLAASVQVFFTAFKLIAIGIIIVGGFIWIGQGKTHHLTGFTSSATSESVSSISLAFYDALWAYDGWNTLNYVTEELKNPYVNLPLANIFGMAMVTVLYILANISYIAVLGVDGILESSTIAVTWGQRVLGPAGIVMPIFVMFSTFGSANGSMFSGVRTLYAAAREHQFPEVLSYVSCKRYTPIPCIVFTTTLSLLMLIHGDVESLIDFFSLAALPFYALTTVSLVVLRFTMKDAHRHIKIFLPLPLMFIVCFVYLTITPIIQDPTFEYLYTFVIIMSGLVVYLPFVHYHIDNGCFKPVTRFIQCLIEVVPSPYDPDNN
ncbi:b(0,+)-type amino acid transporter 1-like [Ylistrum balloti]|uniref:b(0,+)-type amino acid transporter 1-like n=1 Tax=Ylistrum balloti TaxID=509963 RepID=UPI0029059DF6|nr:b(0,+)-type amino acid transporter 1-like [Ylistrum balloti]